MPALQLKVERLEQRHAAGNSDATRAGTQQAVGTTGEAAAAAASSGKVSVCGRWRAITIQAITV